MNQILSIISRLVNDSNAVSVDYQQVDSFHKLILDQLPYGQIDPNSLVQGVTEFDGPAQTPPNGKKPLQWYFGGVACEISKAIRIQYSYQKYLEGVQVYATGSLFVGYELSEPYRPKAVELGDDAERNLPNIAKANKDEVADAERAVAARDAIRNAEKYVASTALPRDAAELIDQLRRAYDDSPSRVTPLARYVDAANFDDFIEESFPFTATAQISAIQQRAAQLASHSPAAVGATSLSAMFKPGGADGVRIEYDGPARDYYSYKPFPYTTESLFNDPSGLYNKVLWWYFGGRSFRITKALRIACDNGAGFQGSLLVGYQGPGPS